MSAGLHLVAWLPPGLDEATVVDAAAGAGVGIEGVTPYRISHPGPGGLVFGYATVNEHAIAEGVDILAASSPGCERGPALLTAPGGPGAGPTAAARPR